MHLKKLAIIGLLLQKTEAGFECSENQGAGYAPLQVHGFFYVYLVMVGILGSCKACWFLDPVVQPDMSAAQCLNALAGGNPITIKEAFMPNSNVAQLRPSNNVFPGSISACEGVIPLEELIINMPECLDIAVSYMLEDFDYLNHKQSNLAVAVRMIAIASDRLKGSLEVLK